MIPRILGVSDSIRKDFPEDSYASWTNEEKVMALYRKSIRDLCDFLSLKEENLREELTDFVSIEPASLFGSGYGHSVKTANSLGFTGFRSHVIDLGGASVTGAVGQAGLILEKDPQAVVLVAAADVPHSSLKSLKDLQRVNETVGHQEWELPHGASLIAMYGLLAKRLQFESGITQEELEGITYYFRNKAKSNPRAVNYQTEIREKQIKRLIADPYSAPMIAVVTDHGFATLLVSEEKAKSWIEKGWIRKDLPELYLTGYSHTAHAEYMLLKGNFETPAKQAASEALYFAGRESSEVDYAWIYDCFTGMIITEASHYFDLDPKDVARTVSDGFLEIPGKKIPINRMGGILNYQAAMSISAATGLVDVLAQNHLYANPPADLEILQPSVSLLGGNGGIDSINSVAVFSRKPDRPKKISRPKCNLSLNRVGCKPDEMGSIFSYTQVKVNIGSGFKTPYLLALIQFEKDRFILANLVDAKLQLLTDGKFVIGETKVKMHQTDSGQWLAEPI